MLKTVLIALACSAATATAVLTYTGRTVQSSPFQLDIPYGAGLKTTTDPANVWSWHHEFTSPPSWQPVTVNVLVDFDGNNVMDTEYSWLRVMVTDMEIVTNGAPGTAWILDGTGKRLAVGTAGVQNNGGVGHVALSSPIVLPVGSPLQVQLVPFGTATFEVHLVGRVVSL
jgi:hypothetical protein